MINKVRIGEIYSINHIFPKHEGRPHLTEILGINYKNNKVKILSGMFLNIPVWVEVDRFFKKDGYNAKYYGMKFSKKLEWYFKDMFNKNLGMPHY